MNKSEMKLHAEYISAGGIGAVLSAQSNVGDNRRFNAMASLVKKGILKVEHIETNRFFGNRRITGDYHQHYSTTVRCKMIKIG